MRKLSVLLLVAVTATFVGCGPQNEIEKVVISGTVTRDGKPMPKGRITFFPIGDTYGPTAGAEILDGKYYVDIHGGVPVGKHRVAFHEVVVDPNRDPTRPPPMVENNILPKRYHDESKLEITVEPGSEHIVKDFDLDEEFGPLEDDERLF